MPRHHSALAWALVAFWLGAAVPASALADDAPLASAAASEVDDGAALFNPLVGAGAPVAQPVGPYPDRQQGDWGLPVVAAMAGLFGVGWLMRKMID